MSQIQVLDKGFVRLVSYMQTANIDASWRGDLEIVRNARVSYDADWRVGLDEGKDEKLINYMVANKHTSPFEAMVFTFEVKAPIFVLRQWHRHRTWSYNEVSARYAELPEDYYIPSLSQITTQSTSNKQMRTTEQHPNAHIFADGLAEHSEECFGLYKIALESGIPRELARCFLPLNTYSRMFCTVDLHNLFHFLRLRLHTHAQWEIRQYAKALLEFATAICPIACESFKKTLGEGYD